MVKVVIFDFLGVVFNPKTRLPGDGLVDFLELLQHHHIPCGIASSTEREHIAQFLQDHDLASYFGVIIGLNQVTATKPDPECYQQVAEFFSVTPEEAVIIDDSAAPLTQAKAVGFQTIFFGQVPNGQTLDNFVKIATLLGL